jgi:hypothetical protein
LTVLAVTTYRHFFLSRNNMMRYFYIVRYPTGAYGLYSQDGFLHIDRTIYGLLRRADVLSVSRRRIAFRYY